MALPTPEEVLAGLVRKAHDGNTKVVDSARVAQQLPPVKPPAVPSNGNGKKEETRPLGPPPPWLTPEGRPRVAGTAIVPPTPPPKPDTSRLAGGSALRPKDADAVRNRAANGKGSGAPTLPQPPMGGGNMADPNPAPAAPTAPSAPAPVGTLVVPPPQPVVVSTTPAPKVVVPDPAGSTAAIIDDKAGGAAPVSTPPTPAPVAAAPAPPPAPPTVPPPGEPEAAEPAPSDPKPTKPTTRLAVEEVGRKVQQLAAKVSALDTPVAATPEPTAASLVDDLLFAAAGLALAALVYFW